MGQLRIGLRAPDLYLAWSEYENKAGYQERAIRILKAALESNVQPPGSLQEKLEELERVSAANKENVRTDLKSNSSNSNRLPLQDKTTRYLGPVNDRSSTFSRSSSSDSAGDSQKTDHTQSFRGSFTKKRISSLGPPARLSKGITKSASPLTPESVTSSHSDFEKLSLEKYSEGAESPDSIRTANVDPTMDMDLSKTIHVLSGAEQLETPSTICLNDTLERNSDPSPIEAVSSRVDWPTPHEVAKSKDKTYIVMHDRVYMRSQLIGKGGSCKVFKILDENGQVFALKKVKLRGQDPAVIAGYKNEIILLNKLRDNERIIHLIDAEQSDGNLLMVMRINQQILEYGEIDLEKMLQKSPDVRLSINFIRNYWEQMLQAVQAIHDQNIIHSDLKPANFLLVGGCLKLIDFGIAKAIPNDTTNIQRDHQTGTVNYMASEAIMFAEVQGRKQNYLKQGRASDVWSLGCILYRFIYLHPPFGNMVLLQKIHAITNPNHIIPYPEVDDPNVVPVLKGCLIYDPKKRMTIPELLDHPFLKSGNVGNLNLDVATIEQILKKAIKLGITERNTLYISQVCRVN
jgi:serine/threonine-protein kinase TTK/MPS1